MEWKKRAVEFLIDYDLDERYMNMRVRASASQHKGCWNMLTRNTLVRIVAILIRPGSTMPIVL